VSISSHGENAYLDALFNNVAVQEPDRFAKLHVGDPGEAGLLAPAAETTRKSITGAAAVNGTFTSVNALTWTNVAADETLTHISVWDDLTAGNCWWTGALSASEDVEAGDDFTIPIGALTVSLD
jgi:hypothetical protein